MNHVRKAIEGIDDERWAMQAFQKNGRRVRDFVAPFSLLKINRHSSIPKRFGCIRGVVVSFLVPRNNSVQTLKGDLLNARQDRINCTRKLRTQPAILRTFS